MADSFRKQTIVTIATASISMAAGFIFVYLLVGPPRGEEASTGQPGGAHREEGRAPTSVAEESQRAEVGDGGAEGSAKQEVSASGEETAPRGVPAQAHLKVEERSPPQQPAGQSPGGGKMAQTGQTGAEPARGKVTILLKSAFIHRCWEEGKEEEGAYLEKEACGKLPGKEGLANDHLNGIAECVSKFGVKEKGRLSLALKVDFGKRRYRAWLGKSTTLAGIEQISACLRQYYSAVPFTALPHQFSSYLVFYDLEVLP